MQLNGRVLQWVSPMDARENVVSDQVAVRELLMQSRWEDTSLGARDEWPASLKCASDMMLSAHTQIVIFAGPKYVALYNDAYAPTIGSKHPEAFGRPAEEHWAELWSDLEPLLRGVMETGETFSARNRPFYIERHGYPETVYFDVSYSALRDMEGVPCAVLCLVTETTEAVRTRNLERQLAAIISSSDAAILGMDLNMVVTSWNAGAERLYGYTAEDMIGRTVMCLLPVDRQDEEQSILQRIQHGERVDPHDTIRLHRTGRKLEISLTVSPIHDERGRVVGASKIARDVSDRKAAERMQETLLSEMQHRVKNLIAVVRSIAGQTFRRGQGPEQLEAFNERLGALARSQDIIMRGAQDEADLHVLIEEVLSPYPRSSFTLRGPELSVDARTALTFALAIHELATNAVKYGALSAEIGSVAITWSVDDDEFELIWSEQGGPAPSLPDHSGFGSVLIEKVLAHDIQGQVTREFAPTGLVCKVRAPLGKMRWTHPDGSQTMAL